MVPGSPSSYSTVIAFLATAGVVAPLVKRLKLSPILGFLGAGVLLGPDGLGRFAAAAPLLRFFTVSRGDQIGPAAELGVVFLLFSIGLELSWERLRLMRRQVFGLGGLQTLGSAALLAAAGLMAGLTTGAAVSMGLALAMSSTALVLPAMSETGRLHARAGRSVFAILLFQDLSVAPVLVALTLMGHPAGAPGPVTALASACIGLVGIIVVGRLVLRPVFRSAAKAKSQDLFMAASFLVIIGAGLIAEVLGLSMALGAFIAGVLLAETEFRHEIEVLIGPFRDLLLGLFFVSVGLGLNVALLVHEPGLIFGVAAGMLALKTVVGSVAARLFGQKGGSALETGLMIAAGGEFAFVILGQAGSDHLISPSLAQALMVSATLTMFAIPGLGVLGARLGASAGAAEAAARAAPPETAGARPRVIIVGYGRVGRLVGEMLDRHQIAWVAIDNDFRSVEAARRKGLDVYFGDAARPELLERCGLAAAPGVVLTSDRPEAAESVTSAVRRLRPDVVLVARARDAAHARRLYGLGASDVVPETLEAGLQLSEAVLVDIGTPMGFVIASIHEKRDEMRRSLRPDGQPATVRKSPPRRRAPVQPGT